MSVPSALLGPTGQPIMGRADLAALGPGDTQARNAGVIVLQRDYGHVALTKDSKGPRTASFQWIYETQPVVAAVVNKLVRQIAVVPLKAYRTSEGGHLEELPADHALSRLLARPLDRNGPMALKQWLAMPALVHGNALLAKFRGDGPDAPPTELLPLDWRYISAWALRGGPVRVWQTTQTGTTHAIDPAETVHAAWHAPLGWLGVSPLRQLEVTLRLEDGAQRFEEASLENGARPSGAIVLPADADLDPSELEELRKAVQSVHGGVDNAFRVALLAGGADWKPMAFSAAEAELSSSRTRNRDEVCMVYDVSPALIGDTSGGTQKSVTEIHDMLYKTTLPPWFAMIEDALQAQLIDPEQEWQGLTVRFDLTDLLRGDPAAEGQAQTQLVAAGIVTRNEARSALGLPRLADPEADRIFYPANNQLPLGERPGGAQPSDLAPDARVGVGGGEPQPQP